MYLPNASSKTLIASRVSFGLSALFNNLCALIRTCWKLRMSFLLSLLTEGVGVSSRITFMSWYTELSEELYFAAIALTGTLYVPAVVRYCLTNSLRV